MHRLSDRIDWQYTLREFWNVYRFGSAGGSKPIRTHQRDVRNRISEEMDADPQVTSRDARQLPVCAWLGRAVDQGLLERTAPLVRALRRVLDEVEWEYGYERVPRGLTKKYGYAELMGPRGPVVSTRVILGVVLFAPRCTYPAHSHAGVSESYICLSGVISESNSGVYAPGSLLFNPPEATHRMTTGDFEPTLLAYAWSGPPAKLVDQPMSFSRNR